MAEKFYYKNKISSKLWLSTNEVSNGQERVEKASDRLYCSVVFSVYVSFTPFKYVFFDKAVFLLALFQFQYAAEKFHLFFLHFLQKHFVIFFDLKELTFSLLDYAHIE